MGKFKTALNKATSKRDYKRPKEKHLTCNNQLALNENFDELPFSQATELLLKLLSDKSSTLRRLRTLSVIHFLFSTNKSTLLNWFQSTSLHIEIHRPDNLLPLLQPYYSYMKLKSKYNTTLYYFLSSSNISAIKNSPNDLFQKIDELLLLFQALVDIKQPMEEIMALKLDPDSFNYICSLILADSQGAYLSLKGAVGVLWSIYKNLEAYMASRAQKVFLRYNDVVKRLKRFAEKFPEQFPGQIPKYNLLSEESLKEVDSVVRGKENANTCPNFLEFENCTEVDKIINALTVNRASLSPQKAVEVKPKHNSSQSVQYFSGFPMFMYSGNMIYPQQPFYPYPNSNREFN